MSRISYYDNNSFYFYMLLIKKDRNVDQKFIMFLLLQLLL